MAKVNRRAGYNTPLLKAYRNGIAATDDPFEKRLISVWPFLIKRARAYYDSLKPVEKSNLDYEDVIMEIVLSLKESDESYDPERGNYITFTSFIIRQTLAILRDRSRTVEAPRNGCAHARRSAESRDNPDRAKTLADILRTGETPVKIDSVDIIDPNEPEPVLLDALGQRLNIINRDLADAFRKLNPKEAFVIVRLFGIFGFKKMSEHAIANRLRVTVSDVCEMRSAGLEKLEGVLHEEDFFGENSGDE